MLKLLPIPIYQCSLNRKTFFGVYYVFNIWHFKCPPPDARYRSEKIAPAVAVAVAVVLTKKF